MTPYKLRLLLEWLILFFGVPLFIASGVIHSHNYFVLIAAMLACYLYLCRDKTFTTKRLCGLNPLKVIDKTFIIRAVICTGILLLFCGLFYPELLFSFIKAKPLLWLLFLFIYPAFSVWPQELIYRAFMFRRYLPLFGRGTLMPVCSATAFAFMHIIFFNWPALILTFIGGFIFARDYQKTGRLGLAFWEHTVYGNLAFTIGAGYFFFTYM